MMQLNPFKPLEGESEDEQEDEQFLMMKERCSGFLDVTGRNRIHCENECSKLLFCTSHKGSSLYFFRASHLICYDIVHFLSREEKPFKKSKINSSHYST